jgi:hypothetical protein
MFKAAANQGFSMTFENGNTVSVQWGPGNYCDARHSARVDAPMNLESGFWESGSAEVAAWNADKEWHNFGTCPDTGLDQAQVQGWRTPAQVAEFIAFVSSNELNTVKEKETDNGSN